MDYFDKEIYKLYAGDKENEMPEGLAWDDMKSGIFSRMNEKKPKRRGFWLWSLGIVLLGIGIAAIYGYYKTNTERNSTLQVAFANKEESIKTAAEKNEPLEGQNEDEPKGNIDESDGRLAEVRTLNFKEKHKKHYQKSSGKKSITDQNTKAIGLIIADTAFEKKGPYGILQNTEHPKNETKAIVYDISQNEDVKGKRRIAVIELKQEWKNELQWKRNKVAIDINSSKEYSSFKKSKNITHSLSIAGGTLLHSGIKIGEETGMFSQNKPGYGLALGWRAQRTDGWEFSVEMKYSFLVDRLDFRSIDTSTVRSEGAVVGRLTNTVSGRTEDVLGTALVDQIRSRLELSYNTSRILSISLGIQKSVIVHKKWSLAPGIYVAYNRIIEAEGKGIDAMKEVFAYTKDHSSIRKDFLSPGIALDIEYLWRENIGLFGRLNNSFSLRRVSNSRLRLSNFQVGMNMKF